MKQIEAGEGYLRELLGGNVRLRLHGNVVRIEADKTSFGKLLEHGDEIVKTLKDLGFVYITTVSYTHLDVYKRQVYSSYVGMGCPYTNGILQYLPYSPERLFCRVFPIFQ